MNLLSVEQVSKTYADRVLFDQISFGISAGDKVALVARNGEGKTTLLNILLGKIPADHGRVTYRKDIRTAYLEQDPTFRPGASILDSLLDDGSRTAALLKAYEQSLVSGYGDFDGKKESSEHLQNLMEQTGAWDYEIRLRQIAGVLGIHDTSIPAAGLSGGQRKRVALARVLVHQPDLLILDEPTNHLDIEMVEWLEDYLRREPVALLMVTHDRYFLDRVCNKILELDAAKLFVHEGEYSTFLENKSLRNEQEGSEREKARNLYFRELEWIRRMPKARGTKSKSRVDAFDDIREKANRNNAQQGITFKVEMSRIGSKILEMKKVNKAFGDKLILKGFDYTFRKGERIGIVGKNGVGKSTFLDMITGKQEPDSGKIQPGETIVFGYYTQAGIQLDSEIRVIEFVRDRMAEYFTDGSGGGMTARDYLSMFGFSHERQHTFVSKLSGGEKRRLHLLTVLSAKPNFLILDEPTNDLDLLTLNVLEEFLLSFEGCLMVVSHDRYFMDKLTGHLLIFDGDGKLSGYTGSYSDYLKQRKTVVKPVQSELTSKAAPVLKGGEKEGKKPGFKEKFEFAQLEKEIPELEERKRKLEEQMNSGVLSHDEIGRLSSEFSQVQKELDEKTDRWLSLSELM
jgi:ATP-binding cassette subfamily F protein uup